DTTVAPDAAAQDGPATQEPSSPVAAAPAAPSDSRPPSARRPPRAPRLAAAPAVARATADPRSACTGKTEFALYRCMVQQCQAAKWTTHPQCVRLRLDDQIN
ncbi:MAG: hypothetical protein M3O01_00820, partial [Pseudomonadota bacterium]|nr:hypothetical protein [Pseudomonadota bacterium]